MKPLLAIIAVLFVAYLVGCESDELKEDEPTAQVMPENAVLLIPQYEKTDSGEDEKGGKGRFVIFKDYSRNFPGIYSLDGEQFLEVVEKDDRYIARLPRGRYILELVLSDRSIIYPANILRPGDVIRYGWKNFE